MGRRPLMALTHALMNSRALARGARRQHSRLRRAVLRGLRDEGRPVRRRRRDRGEVLRRTHSRTRPRLAAIYRARWTETSWPAMKERFAAIISNAKSATSGRDIFAGTTRASRRCSHRARRPNTLTTPTRDVFSRMADPSNRAGATFSGHAGDARSTRRDQPVPVREWACAMGNR